MLGVPGLVQATRDGNVAIANPLGTGLVQTPALIPFLPRCAARCWARSCGSARVETWWCGQPDILEHVLAHIGDDGDQAGVPGRPRSVESRCSAPSWTTQGAQKLVAAIRAAPARYVAQRRVLPSTVPVIEGDQLRERSLVLRTFVVADGATATRRCRARCRAWAAPPTRSTSRCARRAQQGHVGGQRRRGQRVFAAAAAGAGGRAVPRRRRSAQPRRRQLLLARPLRRARRGDRAAGARRVPAARRPRPALVRRRPDAAASRAARADADGVGRLRQRQGPGVGRRRRAGTAAARRALRREPRRHAVRDRAVDRAGGAVGPRPDVDGQLAVVVALQQEVAKASARRATNGCWCWRRGWIAR